MRGERGSGSRKRSVKGKAKEVRREVEKEGRMEGQEKRVGKGKLETCRFLVMDYMFACLGDPKIFANITFLLFRQRLFAYDFCTHILKNEAHSQPYVVWPTPLLFLSHLQAHM